MTANEFAAECGQRLIMPEIALENERIVAALRERDDDKVRELLDNEF